MNRIPIKLADGIFTALFSATGLSQLTFPPDQGTPKPDEPIIPAPTPKLQRWVQLTEHALRDVLTGKTPGEIPPLDLSVGTPFQQKVWAALQRIPSGQTRTYSRLAESIGRDKSARAVGSACGANPVPVLVPCHRVVAQGHRLGGFSAGLDWKRRLLAREGVSLT